MLLKGQKKAEKFLFWSGGPVGGWLGGLGMVRQMTGARLIITDQGLGKTGKRPTTKECGQCLVSSEAAISTLSVILWLIPHCLSQMTLLKN